ncbi:hypothetical protein ACLOJK_039314 [Asimina triloba]
MNDEKLGGHVMEAWWKTHDPLSIIYQHKSQSHMTIEIETTCVGSTCKRVRRSKNRQAAWICLPHVLVSRLRL